LARECLHVIVVKRTRCAIATQPAIVHQDNLDHLVLQEQMACQELPETKVKMAKDRNQLRQCPSLIWAVATNVHLDRLDLQDQLELRAKVVEMDLQVAMAMMANQAQVAPMANQAQLDLLAQTESPAPEALQAIQELLAEKDRMDLQVMLDHLALQDRQVAKATTVNRDQLDLQDHLDRQVIRAETEHLAPLAHQDHLDRLEKTHNIVRAQLEAQLVVEKAKSLYKF